MDGKQSLKEYLSIYETYFDRKFTGDSRDKTQMLAKFLSGDLLRVFDIRGGRRLKFPAMKEQLLQYYRGLKIGGKSYWQQELASASPEPDESLDIFGMRLAEIAEMAYPSDKKECARHLRNSFLKSIHPSIQSRILDHEAGLKASTSGKTKYLAFNNMVQMAKDLQKKKLGTAGKTVLWASHLSDGESQLPSEEQKKHRSREFYQRRPQPNDDRPPAQHNRQRQRNVPSVEPSGLDTGDNAPTSPVRCTFCKWPGHSRRECWRILKLCLICGRDHPMESCPKYNPQHRSRSQGRSASRRPLN